MNKSFKRVALVFAWLSASPVIAAELVTDVAVVGGGSAGFAAALSAAEAGCDTILIEKEDILGGTSTICGVNNWEPVCGAIGTPRRVYERLAQIPEACGIWYQKLHSGFGDAFPGAYLEIDPSLTYDNTLKRHGPAMSADKDAWLARYHGISFEPDQLDAVMRQMLAETGRCRVLSSVAYESCDVRNGAIEGLYLSNGTVVRPKVVIDACGYVAKSAGCASEMSENPNSVTLIFRVSSDPDAEEIPVPDDTPDTCWWDRSFPLVFCCQYPNGDLNVNMLPTMQGSEAVRLGDEAAYAECRKRVFAQWKWMKATYPQHFGSFKITRIFPRLGYRETHRIVCEHMLTGAEVASGTHFEDEIATADHAFDNHGVKGAYSGELSQPYGIPLRSLKPLGVRNLYVAGRIAGFDVAAASSCRLSRTMMQLGEAAGIAAAKDVAGEPPDVDVSIVGSDAVITVGAGVADDDSELWLACGPSDAGLRPKDWPVLQKTDVALSAAGKTFTVPIPAKADYHSLCLRAFVLKGDESPALRTDRRAYIDLKEAPALDRRYEIRLRYDNVPTGVGAYLAPFGGVSRDGQTTVFQLYANGSTWQFYPSAQNHLDASIAVTPGLTYDFKMEVVQGEQRFYCKRASESEYTFCGSTSLDSILYTDNLWLFARRNHTYGADFGTEGCASISLYRVSEISTGAVLKELVPHETEQGCNEMLDTVTGDSYPNTASSGAFVYELGYEKLVASPLACYAGADIEEVSWKELQVSVAPGVSDGGKSLLVCWGDADAGADIDSWDHAAVVCEAIPPQGGVYAVSCKDLGMQAGQFVRALVKPNSTVAYYGVNASCLAGGINLGTSSPDRQYDIRFKCTSAPNAVALFGGLKSGTSGGRKIFQIWAEWGALAIWFGDETKTPLFTPELNALYDVRIVMRDGEQKAYVKKAGDAEYELKATASIPGVSAEIPLALLARNNDGTIQFPGGASICIDGYAETDLATGNVLRRFVPVRYGENNQQMAVYDIVHACRIDVGAGTTLEYGEADPDARPVVLPFMHRVESCHSIGGALNLGYAAADRQYDIRCQFATTPVPSAAIFGGITETKNHIIQLFGVNGAMSIWFGDTTRYDLFSPEANAFYDMRLVMRNGKQEAYVKMADETEYSLKASAQIAAVPTEVPLYLLDRHDPWNRYWNESFLVSRYVETDLATGAVLRELVPVRYGESDQQTAIYDIAQAKFFSGVEKGQLAFSEECVSEPDARVDRISVSSLTRIPSKPARGLFIVISGN